MTNLHDDEEEQYFDQVSKLSERLNGDSPDERIRLMARQEAEKLIAAYLKPVIFIGAIVWAQRERGTQGVWTVLALGVASFIWTVVRTDFDPKHDQHLIVMHAEDLNRLTIIAEAHEAGEPVWSMGEKQYPSNRPGVVANRGARWDGSWKRIYNWALELERVSPNKRRKRLLEAAKQAKLALEQGAALAEKEKGELTFWARNYLHKLRQD